MPEKDVCRYGRYHYQEVENTGGGEPVLKHIIFPVDDYAPPYADALHSLMSLAINPLSPSPTL